MSSLSAVWGGTPAEIEFGASIYKSPYLVRLSGTRLVKAAFCQPAEIYQRAATERRCRTATFVYSSLCCTIVAVSATSDTA